MTRAAAEPPSLSENRFLRFLVAGGIAAICNFASRFVYSEFFAFGVAVVLAYVTGIVVAYLLNKRFVFTDSGNSAPVEIMWFVVVNLFAILQTWALSVYLVSVLPPYMPVAGEAARDLAEALAHGAGVMLPVFTSYLGHKYLTFRE